MTFLPSTLPMMFMTSETLACWQLELFGKLPGPGDRAEVGGNDDIIGVALADHLLKIGKKDRCAKKVVDGDIEESLYLRGVKIHRKNPVCACLFDEVCDQLGRDGITCLGLAVLPAVAEVGDNSRYPAGRSPAQGVDHYKHFHQVVVDRGAGGLNDKNIAASDRLLDGNRDLAVGEGGYLAVSQRHAYRIGDGLGQGGIGVARENLDLSAVINHMITPKIFVRIYF